MSTLSPAFVDAWARVLDLAGPDGSVPPWVVAGVRSLWQRFTKRRKTGDARYMDEAEARHAYLAYYFPVNAAKILNLLAEMPAPDFGMKGAHRSFNVLDVGSGPGTAALAILDWSSSLPGFADTTLNVVAVDASAAALEQAARLWDAYRSLNPERAPATLRTIQADIQRHGVKLFSRSGSPSYDLIVVANLLNECYRAEADPIPSRAAVLHKLLGLLDPHGTMMVIEPALRDTARDFHLTRNTLLAVGGCNVYSPCLHERPCPALIHPKDWCHEERPWNPPLLVTAIDREAGLIKDSLKFSYLLLRKDGQQIVPREPGLFRVVSDRRQMKGEQRAWVCSERGRPEMGRLDRMRSPENASFDEWHRGAIVRVAKVDEDRKAGMRGNLIRIQADTTVEVIRSIHCHPPRLREDRLRRESICLLQNPDGPLIEKVANNEYE